ncbi:MAG: hypothetical protein RDU83_00420 [bacterium]|nr:hypothetical protein [bacterium]
MGQETYLGVGLYSVPEAARIIGVKTAKLRRWVSEYAYEMRNVQYYHRPIIQRFFGDGDQPIVFLELVELLFVRLFRREGVSMQTIRKAARSAAQLFETPYPFAVKRFDTDGKRIFATLLQSARAEESPDRRFIEELGKGQLVFESVASLFFRKLDFGYAEALRYWPLGREGRIVLDPERSFGKPIDAQTGVPTRALHDAVYTGGERPEVVAEWFDVPLVAVKTAVAYEDSLLEAA